MKKTYQIEHLDCFWSMTVEVDDEHPKYAAALKEMVEFWMDWEGALGNEGGNYLFAFLRNLAAETVLNSGFNVEYWASSREGWYPLDGSYGIKIISIEKLDWRREDFAIEEIKL